MKSDVLLKFCRLFFMYLGSPVLQTSSSLYRSDFASSEEKSYFLRKKETSFKNQY